MTNGSTEWLPRWAAHRGLHDVETPARRPENSRAACLAAVEAGYGIELDLQLSSDGEAMVFHDATLERMTGRSGRVDALAASALRELTLAGGDETIPTLGSVLELVRGRSSLLIELKDADEDVAPTDGRLEARVAALLALYRGPAAVMSFNPDRLRWFKAHAPVYKRGLISDNYRNARHLSAKRRAALAELAELDCADFVNYAHEGAESAAVARARAAGVPIAFWTLRDPARVAELSRRADCLVFEGFAPN